MESLSQYTIWGLNVSPYISYLPFTSFLTVSGLFAAAPLGYLFPLASYKALPFLTIASNGKIVPFLMTFSLSA